MKTYIQCTTLEEYRRIIGFFDKLSFGFYIKNGTVTNYIKMSKDKDLRDINKDKTLILFDRCSDILSRDAATKKHLNNPSEGGMQIISTPVAVKQLQQMFKDLQCSRKNGRKELAATKPIESTQMFNIKDTCRFRYSPTKIVQCHVTGVIYEMSMNKYLYYVRPREKLGGSLVHKALDMVLHKTKADAEKVENEKTIQNLKEGIQQGQEKIKKFTALLNDAKDEVVEYGKRYEALIKKVL